MFQLYYLNSRLPTKVLCLYSFLTLNRSGDIMIQKVLFPRWNNLSSRQKTLVKEWVDSLIKAEASRKKLSESLLDTYDENQSASIDDFPNDFTFEVVDPLTSSEGIRIEQIIPSSNLQAPENTCEALCAAICTNSSSPNCLQSWKKKLCEQQVI